MRNITRRYLKDKWPGNHAMHELIDYIPRGRSWTKWYHVEDAAEPDVNLGGIDSFALVTFEGKILIYKKKFVDNDLVWVLISNLTPVTIAPGSEQFLSIDEDQVLSIDVNSILNDYEIPAGDVDGENVTYELRKTPNPYTVRVYRDGDGDAIRLTPGVHYTLSGKVITVLVDLPNNIYPLYPGEQLLVYFDPFDVASEFIVEETPTGAINGLNKDFVLANIADPNRIWVYKNGPLQRPGIKYTPVGDTISFINPPYVGETIRVDYWAANEPDGVAYNVIPTGDINGVNTDFALPTGTTNAIGFRNGVRVFKGIDYTLTGLVASFTDPPKPDERLLFDITI